MGLTGISIEYLMYYKHLRRLGTSALYIEVEIFTLIMQNSLRIFVIFLPCFLLIISLVSKKLDCERLNFIISAMGIFIYIKF